MLPEQFAKRVSELENLADNIKLCVEKLLEGSDSASQLLTLKQS